MTTGAHITLLAIATCAACSEDVQLGVALVATPDAAMPVEGWVAGPHMLVFGTSLNASCNGTLAGREADFEAQSLAELGLLDAPVIVTPLADDVVRLGGAELESSFGSTLLELQRTTIGSGGVFIWFTRVEKNFGSGPASTMHPQRELEFGEPISSPAAATARLRYVSDASSCELFVPVTLVR